jgi:integrase/recombinase XerD
MTYDPQAREGLSGIVVPTRAALSARDVDAAQWGQEDARAAAVALWLTSKPSQHTREAYGRDLESWFDWCDDLGIPLNDARRADVDGWRDYLFTLVPRRAPATVARTISAVSSFYDYWMHEDVVRRNPAKHATRPNVSKAPGSIALTEQQCAAIIQHVGELADRGDRRPAVIIRLLAETGMRVSELCGALVTDLSMSSGNHILTVTRKGSKSQALVITPSTREAIAAYLGERTAGYLVETRPAERSSGDGAISRSYVRELCRRVARDAGLDPAVVARMSPHVFRHSAATLLAEFGVPVHQIQALLGHSVISSTQRYIQHRADLDASPTYVLAQRLAR